MNVNMAKDEKIRERQRSSKKRPSEEKVKADDPSSHLHGAGCVSCRAIPVPVSEREIEESSFIAARVMR